MGIYLELKIFLFQIIKANFGKKKKGFSYRTFRLILFVKIKNSKVNNCEIYQEVYSAKSFF